MRVLILGGTDFLGRHITERALADGARVTLFNRGRTNPQLFPDVEKLRGDRAGDLTPLRGRSWDAAIDVSGYFPAHVAAAAQLLAPAVAHYTLISSISVYRDLTVAGIDERTPTHGPAPDDVAVLTPATYGPLKVACERVADRALAGRLTVVRAGLLLGPWDNVPRLAYWLRRVARGGDVLAPGAPERPVQLIDARDVARWILTAARLSTAGKFNVTGEAGALTIGALLEACRAVTGSDARFVWAPDPLLHEAGVAPLDGLPYWVPEAITGVMQVSVVQARLAGLAHRPLDETVRDTWSWLRTQPQEEAPLRRTLAGLEFASGIAPALEAEILARAMA